MATFDDNIWYRLTSPAAGANISLDNDNDGMPNGFTTLSMAPTGDYSGQFWQISNTSDGFYQLCASFLGPGYRMGYWVDNTNSPPTYYPGLFTGEPRKTPGQQWTINVAGTAKDGAKEYSVKNNQAGFYMDVSASVDNGVYQVYLGGKQGSENFTWKIVPDGPINDALYSPISSTTSASATSSKTTRTKTSVPTGSLPSADTSSSTAGPQEPVSRDGRHVNPLAISVGVPVAAIVAIVAIIVAWSFYRKQKQRQMEEKSGNQTTTSGTGPNSAVSPRDGDVGAVHEFYGPDSKALGRTDSHEIGGSHVQEMEGSIPVRREGRSPTSQRARGSTEQRMAGSATSPVARQRRSSDVDEIAELEGDDVMTRKGIREV